MPPPQRRPTRIGDSGALLERYGESIAVSFPSNGRPMRMGAGVGVVFGLFYASSIVGPLIWLLAPIVAYVVLLRGSGARVRMEFDRHTLRVSSHGLIERELLRVPTKNIRAFEADDEVVLVHEMTEHDDEETSVVPLPIRGRGTARTFTRLLDEHREELLLPPVREGGYR